jgi:hypothetical protein
VLVDKMKSFGACGLCKISVFHGGDYEECRLLGYKHPVRTSQETHYVSTTESSQLMLCKFEVFTAVTMKNAVFWDVTLFGSCKNRRFGGFLPSWWWRCYVPPISRFLKEPHDVTSQKTPFFMQYFFNQCFIQSSFVDVVGDHEGISTV